MESKVQLVGLGCCSSSCACRHACSFSARSLSIRVKAFSASLAFAQDSAGEYVRMSSGKSEYLSMSNSVANVLLVSEKNAIAIILFFKNISQWLFVSLRWFYWRLLLGNR